MSKASSLFLMYGYPIVLTPFVEKSASYSLNYFGIFVKNQLTIKVRAYFWTVYSVALTDIFILKLL